MSVKEFVMINLVTKYIKGTEISSSVEFLHHISKIKQNSYLINNIYIENSFLYNNIISQF